MSEPSSSVPSILFVDDEPSILSALKRLFRPEGYSIFTAESGMAGLETMRTHSVDVVISDMRMPEMDGAAFLEKVRNEFPNTVRILLTGYADINSTVSAINKGEIHKYISKPIDDQTMLLAVREAAYRA
ncbi:MAG: response regulator, partial [Paucibacter sp.]|nr:response regulator [Roseateles sp.]